MTYWTYQGLKRLLAALQEAEVVTEAGASTSGNAVFVSDTNPSLLKVGMTISSPAFPAGTKVNAVAGANVTMNANATATTDPVDVTGVLPAGILEPVSLHACTGVIPNTPGMLFDDLTEADFNGYVAKELTPSVVQMSDAAHAALAYGCIKWEPSNYAVVNTISGVAFTIPGGGDPILLAVEVFEAPITLAVDGQVLSMLPTLNLPYIGGGPFSPIL